MTAVLARGLRRSFGARQVIDGVGLSIEAGEFVALLGRSGSGKSTILRALAGLDPDVEGDILVPERRAVVFQEARLLPWQRTLTNVTIGLRRSAGMTAAQARARGTAALAEVGLTSHARAWPATLSGGEAQRVALARALVRQPQLVLLDEPFGALDALTRLKMHALLEELCRRHHPAVLLVTHDVDEAILLADRVLVLTAGRISLDIPIDFPKPRYRASPEFATLRATALAELGVEETADNEIRSIGDALIRAARRATDS